MSNINRHLRTFNDSPPDTDERLDNQHFSKYRPHHPTRRNVHFPRSEHIHSPQHVSQSRSTARLCFHACSNPRARLQSEREKNVINELNYHRNFKRRMSHSLNGVSNGLLITFNHSLVNVRCDFKVSFHFRAISTPTHGKRRG